MINMTIRPLVSGNYEVLDEKDRKVGEILTPGVFYPICNPKTVFFTIEQIKEIRRYMEKSKKYVENKQHGTF